MTDNLAPSLVLGMVTETQSSVDGLKVRLQRLDRAGGIETDWIPIASPAAGNKAGFGFVPEIEDVAIVAFNGTRPIVLGFIYGGGMEAPSTDPLERIIQSRDGNALVLIDGDKSGITLRDKHNNEITMNKDGITIKTDGDLNLTASGTTTIKGATVELNPMIVQVPDDQAYGAAVLTGWTRATQGGTARESGAVVVKAAYDLVAAAGGSRQMVLAGDPERAAIAYADEEATFGPDGKLIAFDPVREADTAMEKARTDIVVARHVAGATGGAVRIDGDVWIRRTDKPAGAGDDVDTNLFGWLPRGENPRAIKDDPPFDKDIDVLPAQYWAGVNNFHRRGGAFSTPGGHIGASLPSGGAVEIFQTADQSDTAYAFTLPDLQLVVRLRVYCGHGADEAPHWRIAQAIAMDPDTLIVAPDIGQATILWRANWPWAIEPADTYRKLQVLKVLKGSA